MHHHGYTWLGSAQELLKDGPRRPLHPEFRSSKAVPLECAHWLLKPVSFVQGTWGDPRQAAEWFGQQVRASVRAFASDYDRDTARLADAIGRMTERVASGEDVVGGWYLTGQRFLSVCLVACSPHRMRPEIACPVGATT
ncbi:hypothetical protein [Streptomyces violaceusniger]|uniref:Uncharacterized protein n=1 Tax=Streptomyces violaceusniger (strain Tu 4113) TaxID=653045 RepID=G2NT88_STRV4|nr:hypothetical protein [Streptomyces violaceusniger]AEM81508.1 hypothetical protein Strvi_1770 [Streptomyces violaceusniger Tu 4113]